MALIPNVTVKSIRKTKEYETNKYTGQPTGSEVWLVKFDVPIKGVDFNSIALTYETEGQARKWGEGRTYTLLEWFETLRE